MKPRIFVGSSVESLQIAEAIQENLEFVAEVTPWSEGIFNLSITALDSLLEILDTVDFGIFVLSSDDIVQMREEQHSAARDNVIFELGLFIGRLGKERCFIVTPRNTPSLHLPSDLTGFSPATYDADRSDKNWTAALGYACTQIKRALGRLGRFNTSQPTVEIDAQSEQWAKNNSFNNQSTFVDAAWRTLDQTFTTPNNLECAINEGFAFVAQTYTAQFSGKLVGVNVSIESHGLFPLHIALREVKNGAPTSIILGEVTVPSGNAPLSHLISFPEQIAQVAGIQYAIVVNYEGAPSAGVGRAQGFWTGATGNRYLYGNLFLSADDKSWFASSINDHDVHFQTFVDVT